MHADVTRQQRFFICRCAEEIATVNGNTQPTQYEKEHVHDSRAEGVKTPNDQEQSEVDVVSARFKSIRYNNKLLSELYHRRQLKICAYYILNITHDTDRIIATDKLINLLYTIMGQFQACDLAKPAN